MTTPKKMGRPVTKLRNRSLHLRISDTELQLIAECSELSGLSRTDAIIKGLNLLKEQLNK